MIWKPVRAPAWTAFRAVSRGYLALSGRDYHYVFILGHMRSGSTLLSHILASHPDIVGAGETHVTYRTPADLQNLLLKTCEFLHRPILRETYVIDQINHPFVSDDVLRSERLYKCIILLREPEATLKSMIKLGIWEEKQAVELYVSRLETLVHYGLLLGQRAFLVEYDDLVERTDQTLAALTGFLSLESPLNSDYTTHRMTGRVSGYGDPSGNIKLGRIVRTPAHDVTLSEKTVSTASRAFQECHGQLRDVIANGRDE